MGAMEDRPLDRQMADERDEDVADIEASREALVEYEAHGGEDAEAFFADLTRLQAHNAGESAK
jgi:hypothetical protein